MYCPYCDMDFVEGVTVCSDCGRPLITREAYELQLRDKQEAEAEQKRLAAQERIKAAQELEEGINTDQEPGEAVGEDPEIAQQRSDAIRALTQEPAVYVSKASAYEDNRSSAGAFLTVGGAVTVVMILVYAKIITLPAAFDSLLTRVVLTVIGIGFVAIGFMSLKKAVLLKKQAAQEAQLNEELILWFLDTYTKDELDRQARLTAGEDAGEEEIALARLSYIQDQLLINHDIADKTYADSLSEEIYARIFEV